MGWDRRHLEEEIKFHVHIFLTARQIFCISVFFLVTYIYFFVKHILVENAPPQRQKL